MAEYSTFDTVAAIPEASSMIETFRAIGYNVETAIADILDNSFSADARNIWIDFDWMGSDTWLSIKDDGLGMDNEELIKAMTPGSKNPIKSRSAKDLGRFGLGLKTASFSQARMLTVVSKKSDHEVTFWTWDLDHVNRIGKWELVRYIPEQIFQKELEIQGAGTFVIWNNIDRLVRDFKKDDNKALDKFLIVMERVKFHLSLVFHKFIEEKRINIFFRGELIDPWNPFLTEEPATQILPIEHIQNGYVKIQGYVLPHQSKLSPEKFKYGQGAKGWNEQQGFYIYRKDRLLVAGSWLGLFRKEEHYKLARIEINLPNSLDEEWQLDIKKSTAWPPLVYREQLKAYALKVRSKAVEVYRHRGKNVKPIAGQKFIPLWLDHRRGDKWFYKINREHPIITEVKEMALANPNRAIENLIRFVEETVPSKSIFIKESESPEDQGNPFEGTNLDVIRDLMTSMFINLRNNQGKSSEEAKAVIKNIEPFNNFPHLIELLS